MGVPSVVVFDLGGVLVDWNPHYLYDDIISDPRLRDWFLTHVCHQQWNRRQDAGRPFATGVAELRSQWPQYSEWIGYYDTRWDEMLGGPLVESVDVLQSLHQASTPLYALSNWSAEKFPIAQQRYSFLQCFDGIVISGEEAVNKPDPRIYEVLCERYGLVPEEAVFIDDSLENVAAANRLGFHGVHFVSAPKLRETLGRWGFVV